MTAERRYCEYCGKFMPPYDKHGRKTRAEKRFCDDFCRKAKWLVKNGLKASERLNGDEDGFY